MPADDYTLRPPQTQVEWDVVPGLLLDYKHEFDDDTCFTTFEEEVANIRKVYTATGSHLILAIDHSDQKIVGCVALRTLSPGVAEMKRLYVIPSHRGFHLGKKLAVAIISYAKEKNYTRMVLDTMMEMKAAQKLYQHLGFTPIEPYRDQDPSKVICYEKKLN